MIGFRNRVEIDSYGTLRVLGAPSKGATCLRFAGVLSVKSEIAEKFKQSMT